MVSRTRCVVTPLAMSLKLVPKPPAASKGGLLSKESDNVTAATSDTTINETIKRINSDIAVVQNKINDMLEAEQAAANPQTAGLGPGSGSVTSPFVSGLRGMTMTLPSGGDDNNSNAKGNNGSNAASNDVKIALIEKFLAKIDEYNKLVIKTTSADLSKSRKMSKAGYTELSLIPSGLVLSDRALDLHSQLRSATRQSSDLSVKLAAAEVSKSKAATELTPRAALSAAPTNPITYADPLISPRSSKAGLAALNGTVSKLTKQLQDTEERKTAQSAEILALRKELLDIRRERDELSDECKQKTASIDDLRSAVADAERIHRLQKNTLCVIESNVGYLMKMTTFLLSTNTGCDGDGRIPQFEPASASIAALTSSSSSGADSDATTVVLTDFDDAVNRLAASVQISQDTQKNIITGLHSDLQCALLDNEMSSGDLGAVTAENAALKQVYQSLQSQLADVQSRRASFGDAIREKDGRIFALEAQLVHSSSRVEQLQAEVAALARRALECSHMHSENAKLVVANKQLEDRELKADFRIKDLSEEVVSLHGINEKLKDKIKELVGKGAAGSGRDFLDSFEEVMRDELMMMKVAFEGKLKRAKEEAETMARRHQEIIRTMQSSKSTTALAL